ncbi:PTS sugar transporter subunit IIA [Clostridium sp. DL1XJH146]
MDKLISKDLIMMDIEASCKDEAIEILAENMNKQGKLNCLEEFLAQVHEREAMFPTSVGYDFCIPHGKCEAVKSAAVGFARLKHPVKWSDEEEGKYIFLIAVSDKQAGDEHLKILAQLSRSIMREEFRDGIKNANTIDEINSLLCF